VANGEAVGGCARQGGGVHASKELGRAYLLGSARARAVAAQIEYGAMADGSSRSPPVSEHAALNVAHEAGPEVAAGRRLVQLSGNYDVRVTLKSGEIVTFKHPIAVEANGDRLTFRCGNRGALEVGAADVTMLEASRLDAGATAAAVCVGTLVGTAIIVGLTIAIASSGGQ
jgi:hypothetical protein